MWQPGFRRSSGGIRPFRVEYVDALNRFSDPDAGSYFKFRGGDLVNSTCGCC
jgi:hypothetical protein